MVMMMIADDYNNVLNLSNVVGIVWAKFFMWINPFNKPVTRTIIIPLDKEIKARKAYSKCPMPHSWLSSHYFIAERGWESSSIRFQRPIWPQ